MSDLPDGSAAAGNPAPVAGDVPAAWYAGFQDPVLRGVAETKGWKSAEDSVKSYFHAEKLMGAPAERIIKLGEDMTLSPEDRQRLGFPVAPEKPEDYGIQSGENGHPEFAAKMAGLLHGTGISKEQAAKLVEGWDGIQKELSDGEAARLKSEDEAGLAELRTTWGQQYDGSVALARRAAQEITSVTGMTPESLSAIEAAIGTAAFLKMFAAVGSQNHKEATFHGSEGAGSSSGGMLSPDVAKARIESLKNDADFGAALMKEMETASGTGPKRQLWEQLHKIAAGSQ